MRRVVRVRQGRERCEGECSVQYFHNRLKKINKKAQCESLKEIECFFTVNQHTFEVFPIFHVRLSRSTIIWTNLDLQIGEAPKVG